LPKVISADDRRWLHNSRINVQRIYNPLIAAAKREVERVRNDVD
jgi:hypothetical protein